VEQRTQAARARLAAEADFVMGRSEQSLAFGTPFKLHTVLASDVLGVDADAHKLRARSQGGKGK
jgi:hypothetical protein